MKKSKAEAERDLLAKNHKRLNKAISDLMDENKDLRQRLHTAMELPVAMQKRFDDQEAAERRNIAGTAMHGLLGIYGTSRTMDQIAEQAWAVADAMMRAK